MDSDESFVMREEFLAGKRERRIAADKYRQLLEDYQKTFSTPHGLRVLVDILDMTHMFSLSMTGNSMTYFNEGERHIGFKIGKMLVDADLDLFVKAQKRYWEEIKKGFITEKGA